MTEHDPEFRLSSAQRAELLPDIDANAVERLLQHIDPETRNHFLMVFSRSTNNQSVQVIRAMGGDPILNELLEQIYAPTWEALGMDAIENSDSLLPGREIARIRLERKQR